MLLNLSDISPEPLHSQLSNQLRALILSGDLAANVSLPSIRQMATEQRISVITVQRAYDDLEREGLIHSRRGKGFFISELSLNDKRLIASERFQSLLKPIIQTGIDEGLTISDIVTTFKSAIIDFENKATKRSAQDD